MSNNQPFFSPYNLPHFEISPATEGGGDVGPDPENKVTADGLI